MPLTFERSVYHTIASEWGFGVATVQALVDPSMLFASNERPSSSSERIVANAPTPWPVATIGITTRVGGLLAGLSYRGVPVIERSPVTFSVPFADPIARSPTEWVGAIGTRLPKFETASLPGE